jgi:hypothetical protein
MGHESPIIKAWREFAMADPDDCDREWAAYLALLNRRETASTVEFFFDQLTTRSTAPLRLRAPSDVFIFPMAVVSYCLGTPSKSYCSSESGCFTCQKSH